MNEETLVTSETTTTPEGEAVVSADGVEAPEAQEQLATGENQGEAEVSSEQTDSDDSKSTDDTESKDNELMSKARDDWRQQATTDKEFGGDQLNANLAVAKKAMDAFGTPELTKLLNESGLGNHPEVIRVFYRAGKAISEDGFVSGQSTQSRVDDPAKRLFPNQL
jgi:hypothetical protein